MRRISWIGVGIMGKAMVRNLMKAGYKVHIYARHPEKVADVVSEGAVPHGSIAECVKASEVVITMVGFPKDVEEVYFAPGNILDSAAKGMTLIDMTTTSPASVVIMACSSRPERTRSWFSTATKIPTAAILKIRSTSIVPSSNQ